MGPRLQEGVLGGRQGAQPSRQGGARGGRRPLERKRAGTPGPATSAWQARRPAWRAASLSRRLPLLPDKWLWQEIGRAPGQPRSAEGRRAAGGPWGRGRLPRPLVKGSSLPLRTRSPRFPSRPRVRPPLPDPGGARGADAALPGKIVFIYGLWPGAGAEQGLHNFPRARALFSTLPQHRAVLGLWGLGDDGGVAGPRAPLHPPSPGWEGLEPLGNSPGGQRLQSPLRPPSPQRLTILSLQGFFSPWLRTTLYSQPPSPLE